MQHPLIKLINKLFFLFALLFGEAGGALAEPMAHRYQVELIVFSHITAESLRSEQWQWTPTLSPVSANAIELTTTHSLAHPNQENKDRTPNAVAVLEKPFYHLTKEDQSLQKQPHYRVLLHLAWQQEITNKKSTSKPIHLFGGHLYTPTGQLTGEATEGRNPSSIWEVNGEVLLTQNRYINLYLNLLFSEPLANGLKKENFYNIDKNFVYFHLKQNRRMRTRELNYIDHPLYGVLIKITPIEETTS